MPIPRRFDRRPPERDETRINDRIRVREVRLIGDDGNQVGVVPTEEALRYAQERDLDLVEVAPDARPPVCRVLDYSKYKYEQEQKAKAARKHQKQVNVREIKLRPKIADNDYETKKNHVVRFLNGDDRVKVTIMFRGREQSHPERGERLLMRLAEDVADLGVIEQRPMQDGRNMTMLLGPVKKRVEDGAAARGRAKRRPTAAPSRQSLRSRPPAGWRPKRSKATGAGTGLAAGKGDCRVEVPAGRSARATLTPPMPKMKTHSGAKKRFRKTAQRQAPRASRHDQPHAREEERQAQAAPRAAGRGGQGRREARQGAVARMSRVKRSVHARKKRRAMLARAKGYRGQKHSSYRRAKEQLLKSDTYAYRDRRNRKRDFRRLWITRINAAARQEGMTYGTFMHGLKLAGVELDRKVLADIAVRDPETFRRFAETAREAAAA